MKIHSDGTQTATFTKEEGENILKNLEMIRMMVESPAFQPDHHLPIWDEQIPLLHALTLPAPKKESSLPAWMKFSWIQPS